MTLVIDDDRLSETFAALANPTRRAILARLAAGEANVNELAEPFDLTLPAISKHIKVLERAGLVVRGQRAQYRPCALDPAPTRAGLDLGRAVPARLGGPLRPHGRVPHPTPTATEGQTNTMTDDSPPRTRW